MVALLFCFRNSYYHHAYAPLSAAMVLAFTSFCSNNFRKSFKDNVRLGEARFFTGHNRHNYLNWNAIHDIELYILQASTFSIKCF